MQLSQVHRPGSRFVFGPRLNCTHPHNASWFPTYCSNHWLPLVDKARLSVYALTGACKHTCHIESADKVLSLHAMICYATRQIYAGTDHHPCSSARLMSCMNSYQVTTLLVHISRGGVGDKHATTGLFPPPVSASSDCVNNLIRPPLELRCCLRQC